MGLIQVNQLNFEYPKKKILNDISFNIKEGSITALVGPNGAGKTTLLRCMTSLETPLSGTVKIDNINVHDHPRDAHRSMGYLSDFFGVYEDLTVRQCLLYMAWCHKLPQNGLKDKIDFVAEEVEITKYLDEKAGTLSRGYRQRLGVGLAIVHDPKVLFLDEPASGMDPEARLKFSELTIRLRDRGMTLIVSSHILAELEDYCTEMLVIRAGEIKSHVVLKEHQIKSETVIQIGLESVTEDHLEILKNYNDVTEVKILDQGVLCVFNGDQANQQRLLKHLIQNNVPVFSFSVNQKTLQSAYMDLATAKDTK